MKKLLIWLGFAILTFLIFIFFWGSSKATDGFSYNLITSHQKHLPSLGKDTLSLATYNVGYFSGMTNNLPVNRSEAFVRKNEAQLISLVRSLDIDILAMQEIDFDADRSFNTDQLKSIAEGAAFASSARAVNWDMNYIPFPYWPFSSHFGKTVSGQGIASRYPILKNKIETLMKPLNAPFWYNQFYLDRLVQIAEINVGRPLIVMNLHLEAFDSETREVQAKRVVELVKEYIPEYPVILTGDFNSAIPFGSETTLKTITEELGLKEAIPDSTTLGKLPAGTFPSDKPKIKIDHVFYHPDQISPVSWSIPDSLTEASDHLPLVFRFTFKSE